MVRNYVRRHPIRTRRALEILPGFVSWSLILFPVWGSFVIPELVAYYVIAFSVYWLYRSLSVAILAIFAHFRIQASRRFYNGNVRDYNIKVQTFPTNLIASNFGFKKEEFFDMDEGEKAVPQVTF